VTSPDEDVTDLVDRADVATWRQGARTRPL
jgi:hypothetical protein